LKRDKRRRKLAIKGRVKNELTWEWKNDTVKERNKKLNVRRD